MVRMRSAVQTRAMAPDAIQIPRSHACAAPECSERCGGKDEVSGFAHRATRSDDLAIPHNGSIKRNAEDTRSIKLK